MLERIFPKERDFFPVFDEISVCLAKAMSELLAAIGSQEDIAPAIENMRSLQGHTDALVRQSVTHLHDSFMTPFDRVHIFRFVVQLGEIVSQTLLVTEKIHSYGCYPLPLESREIILKCGEACGLIRKMVVQIKKIKDPNQTVLLCLKIYQLSSESKKLSFDSLKDQYLLKIESEKLMKISEINNDLVAIVKKFKSIAYLVEEIVLEYA